MFIITVRFGFASLNVLHQEERGVDERETAEHQNEAVDVERVLKADELDHRSLRVLAIVVVDLCEGGEGES